MIAPYWDRNNVASAPSQKISKFRAVREGDLNRFYTRYEVGDLLTNQLRDKEIRTVVDLGAGNGSLSGAVCKWTNKADIVTVDIDCSCIQPLHSYLLGAGAFNHTHICHNVFDPELPNVSGLNAKFDLAVCNPPFFRPEWKPDYADILQAARLEDACVSTADISAELIFLAQNLRLVRSGGAVAMIMPDGIVTGRRAKALRSALLSNHRVDCVLQLPEHSFHDTEARCFILIFTKDGQSAEQIKLLRYDPHDGLSAPLFVSWSDGEHRLDYDYHFSKASHGEEVTTLRALGAEINRGSVGTVEARDAVYPVFHTSDYRNSEAGFISLAPSMPAVDGKRLVIAQAGDILMARVDRKLHEKVGMVISGTAALTDCVYRVRLPNNTQEIALKALRSHEGTARLKALSKGVSARLLGKDDLLDMPLVI